MKTQKLLLLLTALCAAALMAGGCASVPNYSGDLVYYDGGYTWWWLGGVGWRYMGFHGRGEGAKPESHRPPPPGRLPPHRPGKPRPYYLYVGKNGTVRASTDGKSFRDVGDIVGVNFSPRLSGLTPSFVVWYKSSFVAAGKVGAGERSFPFASRPPGDVRQFAGSATGAMSNQSTAHGGENDSGDEHSRISSASDGTSGNSSDSGWSGGGSSRYEGSGGWSGGGDSGHFSGGGFGGSRGGSERGGGGGDRGGGNHGR